MKIRCAVIDDDKSDLQKIGKVFLELSKETKLTFDNRYYLEAGDSVFEPYDIYILDIDMPVLDGFHLANRIFDRYPKACIIFCTNHDDLVFDAFRLNPFYFVRKSLLQDDLRSALRKYIRDLEGKKNEYILRTRDVVVSISLADIQYFEIVGNDLYIHTLKKEYKDRKSMKQLLSGIPSEGFIQISQNYLINCEVIKEIDADKLITKSGQVFTIPRRNIRDVKDRYALYLLGK